MVRTYSQETSKVDNAVNNIVQKYSEGKDRDCIWLAKLSLTN